MDGHLVLLYRFETLTVTTKNFAKYWTWLLHKALKMSQLPACVGNKELHSEQHAGKGDSQFVSLLRLLPFFKLIFTSDWF